MITCVISIADNITYQKVVRITKPDEVLEFYRQTHNKFTQNVYRRQAVPF
jgi:hypothetical protein